MSSKGKGKGKGEEVSEDTGDRRKPRKIEVRSKVPEAKTSKRSPRKLETRSTTAEPVKPKAKPRKLEDRRGESKITAAPRMVSPSSTLSGALSSTPAKLPVWPPTKAHVRASPTAAGSLSLTSDPTSSTTASLITKPSAPAKSSPSVAEKALAAPMPPLPAPSASKKRTAVPTTGELAEDMTSLMRPDRPPRLSSPISDRSAASSLGTASLKSVVSDPPSYFWVPTKDPDGTNRLYTKTKLKIDGSFVKSIDKLYEGRWRTLMLLPGQGGTFGYGDKYWDRKAGWVTIKGQEYALAVDTVTKHLLYFGRNVEFIGTKDCVTCVGVYFEIEYNRVFCAHINAWHWSTRHYQDHLSDKSPEYKALKKSVIANLIIEADKHGWVNTQVKTETLIFVCPWASYCGYAVVAAVEDFLNVRRERPIHAGHGFVIEPGSQDEHNVPLGKLFLYSHNVKMDGEPERLVYDDIPEEVEEVESWDRPARDYLEPWTYTAGRGWDFLCDRSEAVVMGS